MGNRCCRPQNNPEPKYLLLLRLSYSETKKLLEQPLHDNITETLNKKGYIKTLCDHLSSHQHRINPSLDYCKQKLLINRGYQNYVATVHTLTVTSEVSLKIVKLSLQIEDKIRKRRKEKQKNGEGLRGGEKESNVKSRGLDFVIEQFEETIYQICYESMRHLESSNKLVNNKDDKFDEHLLNNYNNILKTILQILFMISQKQSLNVKSRISVLKNILNTLMNIISRDQSIKAPLRGKPSDSENLVTEKTGDAGKDQLFFECSKNNKQVALKTYRNLVRKEQNILLNSNAYKDLVKNHLPRILSYWARDSDQLAQGKQNQIQDKQQSAIEQIILLYFNSYFSEQQSEHIFRQLMTIFDKLKFSRNKIEPIQNLLFQALKDFELREQVMYRWLDYLLDYLTLIGKQFNFLDDICAEYDFVSKKKERENEASPEKIKGCIQTLEAWIDHKAIDVKTVMTYKGDKMITALLLNYTIADEQLISITQKTLEKTIMVHPEAYTLIIETIYRMINKIKYPQEMQLSHGYQNKGFNKVSQPVQIQKFVYNLVLTGCRSLLLECVPGGKILKILRQVSERLYKKFMYNECEKLKAQEYIHYFMTSFNAMLGHFEFDDSVDFNLLQVVEINQSLAQYFGEMLFTIRGMCRDQKSYKNHKIFQASHEEESFSKTKEKQCLQLQRISMIQMLKLYHNGLFSQIGVNLNHWYKMPPQHFKNRQTQHRITNKISKRNKYIQSQLLVEDLKSDIRPSSMIQSSSADFLKLSGKYTCQIYQTMAMCYHMIIALLVRHLLQQIASSEQNSIAIFNLLTWIDICYKNQYIENERVLTNEGKKKKVKKWENQQKRSQQFAKKVEQYLEFMMNSRQTKANTSQNKQSLKTSFRYSDMEQPSIDYSEISEDLLRNRQIIISICDAIGPTEWATLIKQTLDFPEIDSNNGQFCSLFKKNKIHDIHEKKTSYNDDHTMMLQLSSVQQVEKNERKIFEILRNRYQEYFLQTIITRSIKNSRGIQEEPEKENSSKSDNAFSMKDISDGSFNQIVNILEGK